MKSGKSMKMKEVVYVPGLKKNLLSISTLDKKGFRFSFVYNEFLMWTKGRTIADVVVMNVEEGGLYKLKRHTYSTFTASTISPCELWHRKLSHVDCKALPIVIKVVKGLPEI